MSCACPSPIEPFNPRQAGSCLRCGRMIPKTTWERDVDEEIQLTRLAADKWNGDTGNLDGFANARALPGGVRKSLDPVRETQEELADARNYLVWGIQLLGDSPDDDDRRIQLMNALTAVVEAWHALRPRTYL